MICFFNQCTFVEFLCLVLEHKTQNADFFSQRVATLCFLNKKYFVTELTTILNFTFTNAELFNDKQYTQQNPGWRAKECSLLRRDRGTRERWRTDAGTEGEPSIFPTEASLNATGNMESKSTFIKILRIFFDILTSYWKHFYKLDEIFVFVLLYLINNAE